MKKPHKLLPFTAAGMVTAAICITGAVPVAAAFSMTAQAAQLSDYDEEARARLQDNVMEYGELEDLVAVYNPVVKSANAAMDDQLAELETAVDDLGTNAGLLRRTADSLKQAGNPYYQVYEQAAAGVDAAVKGYEDGLEKARSHSATRSLRYVEYQLTSVTQMLMANYQTLTAQQELAAKSKELAEAAYQSTLTRKDLGLATEADVLSSQKGVEQAANGVAAIETMITQIRQNLCMMTGWSYDAQPEIRRISAMDLSYIDSIKLEEDKQKAIGNNGDLISQRSGSSAGSSMKERGVRSRSIDEAEQQLCMELEQKYQMIQQRKLEYQAANAAMESASTAKHAADTKYQTGMIGRLEYLQAEMAYLSKMAAKEQADMALLQAVNDYQWTVRGL